MNSDSHDQGRTWNEIKVGDDVYMISITKEANGFKVFLTNLVELWVETLTKDVILYKCRMFNQLLNVDSLDCYEIVTSMLNDISSHVTETTVEQIQLCTKVEKATFKFVLDFTKANPQEFWDVITKPLCISSMEILRQHRILLDLVKRKDEEIAEYKAEGAELIRKNIATKPFDEAQLQTDLSLPDVSNYSNIFCTMMNFYNALDFHKIRERDTGQACSTSMSFNNKGTDETGQTASSPSLGRIPTADRLVPEKKEQMKNSAKKMPSNIKHIKIMPKPSKKLKKGLNDFIS